MESSPGSSDVLGHTPWKRDRAYPRRMALIMGQHNRLTWDIPVLDSYEMNKAIFRIQDTEFRARRDELIEMLDLGELLKKPVRNLSLCERAIVIHHGTILYDGGLRHPSRASP